MKRENEKSSSATGLNNYGNKLGVDCTEGAVPCDPWDPNVIVALVILHRLAKDMTEFALSYYSSHICRGRKKKVICYIWQIKARFAEIDEYKKSNKFSRVVVRWVKYLRCSNFGELLTANWKHFYLSLESNICRCVSLLCVCVFLKHIMVILTAKSNPMLCKLYIYFMEKKV